MRRSLFRSDVWLTLLVAAALLPTAACGEDGAAPASPTGTATSTVDATAEPTGQTDVVVMTPSTPGEPVFGREPVEGPGDTTQPGPLLVDLRTGTFEQYDRAIFEFDGGVPGYRAEYVSPPITACGSGLPAEIAGDALLQIRMSPAAAHDDAGMPTFEQPELAPNLPALLEMEQTCDFEGDVVWVMGLTGETDFRVFSLMEAALVVDVRHP